MPQDTTKRERKEEATRERGPTAVSLPPENGNDGVWLAIVEESEAMRLATKNLGFDGLDSKLWSISMGDGVFCVISEVWGKEVNSKKVSLISIRQIFKNIL